MKDVFLRLALFLLTTSVMAQTNQVSVIDDVQGMKLVVDGKDFMVNGMNWDYFPVGTTVTYSLWRQSDDVIKAALDREMSLLKNMGVNAVRQYTGVPAKWITYIYEKYGIYTMLNHAFGRYGLTLDGTWVANTEYSDPRVRQLLLQEVKTMAEEYRGTPGLLMYLLGNENNYGLFWEGAETEDIPVDKRKSTGRAEHMYKLFNEGALAIKGIDKSRPVAMCNGDLLFLEIIARECNDFDIFGTNMYRGVSFGDAFQRVKDELNKPILFTEFGSDAFNAVENEEDQYSQAYYMVGNWQEIYENAAGMGKTGNSLGGFTFQFSDGWWKYGQTKNLSVHDNNASWDNGGYEHDFVEGEDNMNEEWFGVCAKGLTNARGLYDLYPRAAYYALKEAHLIDPFSEGTTLESIGNHFSQIQLMDAVIKARGDKAALVAEDAKKLRISNFTANLATVSTGGERISTPKDESPNQDPTIFPNRQGFDYMHSYFIGVTAKPTESVRANISFNILGQVPRNPINEIFYENRGRPQIVTTPEGDEEVVNGNRIQLYRADIEWKSKYFDLKGFHRTGHYHWGYEGDFFGLYPEANYGPNIDIYNGNAPSGVEMTGKKGLNGLKVAFGPELWWGANPAVLVKYSRKIAGMDVTGIFHEDIDDQLPAVSSIAVPIPTTRRATIHMKKQVGQLGVELGGIWAGQPRVGETFQIAREENGENQIYQDQINDEDTWGGKVKFTYSAGPLNWYAQGSAMGVVARGGADLTQTFTGWRLKDNGIGNSYNVYSGFTFSMGDFQFAPNFQWQQPIIDPIPDDIPAPGRPRNILDDPFSVRQNRETVAGEILITYDPTPGTWMYAWDNDLNEDAALAVSAGFVYRHHPTSQDAAIGIFRDGRTLFAFPGAAPAQDLWEAHARIVSKVNPELGFIANLYGGNAQANGSDERLIHRYGADLRMVYKKMKITAMGKINDWGPFDYHRDFNLTFPLQFMLDISTSAGKPSWFDLPNTRVGVTGIWRSLDRYSPRYCPTTTFDASGQTVCDPEAPGFDDGNEWEIRTYLQISINN